MGEVIQFPHDGDADPNDVLDAAKDEFDHVIVVGVNKEGIAALFSSSDYLVNVVAVDQAKKMIDASAVACLFEGE